MPVAGKIVLKSGAQLPLEYRMVTQPDGLLSGELIGDLDAWDPLVFADRLRLVCNDGRSVEVLITHVTDKGALFIAALEVAATNSDCQGVATTTAALAG
ncbi:hypothetical protein AB4Z40_25565 [Bosea sp. 2YAB26]|jgi:hypothetical protein|uniref:hypothetical protein n=1 Tax=Bosea sp. 2YAB26 TaxID=3237478 RepID=UPI003F905AC6